jgi:uncharacterized protein
MKVVLHLTTTCNLRCIYCYAPHEKRGTMSLETAKRGVDLAVELGRTTACVSYFGGEPLLKFKMIQELTRYACEVGARTGTQMHFRLSTNGTLLDEDVLRFCRDHNILFALSLDGDREAHDAQRLFADGRGSFEVIDRKLDMILEYNPHTVVVGVITPKIVDRLSSSIEYLWGRGVRFFSHQPDYMHPDWTPELLAALGESYRELAGFYIDKARTGQHFHMTLFDEKLKSHARSPIRLGETCDFGARKLSVAPDGTIYPCVQFVSDRADAARFRMGHVATGLTPRREQLIEENKSPRPQCEGCSFNGRCSNFCGCLNWQMTGKVTEVPGILCAHEQMLIPIADEVGNTLWDERNRHFLQKHYDQYLKIFPYSFD